MRTQTSPPALAISAVAIASTSTSAADLTDTEHITPAIDSASDPCAG